MFCTFPVSDTLHHDNEQKTQPSPPNSTLPRRRQVWRACDWCRVNRISNRGEIRNLPQAYEEIERLRLRVRDLEEANAANSSVNMSLPASSPNNQNSIECGCPNDSKKPWQGVYSRDPRTQQVSYYGPSSTLYFLSRISSFLGRELQQHQGCEELQPTSASKILARPETSDDLAAEGLASQSLLHTANERASLPRAQEESFLSLFWQFHFCTLPIIDQEEFLNHYQSLWKVSNIRRKPSALADIMLALCMQYGHGLMSGASPNSNKTTDAAESTIAGRWYYHRCQALLANEFDAPSITTVQCHILTVVYLYFASFQNMAYITMSLAVRSAQTLGLHLEPPLEIPSKERDLRKRIWWVLSMVDTKICMKLGRPFSFATDEVSCSVLANTTETVTSLDSMLGTSETGLTWLTYIVHCQELVAMVREIHESLYSKFSVVLAQGEIDVPYENPSLLEVCAEFLAAKMEATESWISRVPSRIKTERRGDGRSFSIDRSPLLIETSAPLWLQRQRLCLELMYNGLVMSLYRPFITFSKQYSICYTRTEAHALACVNHAITHTYIMHQVIMETDLLNGWHDAFQWQWEATVTLLGFLFAYPISSSAPTTRRAIYKAVECFEQFGSNNVGVARNAAEITRNLISKADLLLDRFWVGFSEAAVAEQPSSADLTPRDDLTPMTQAWHDNSSEIWGFLDLALTVDAFHSFEDFVTVVES
ncbi:hypothetical protein V2G26_014765 [Clonostachys chloroleuca]